MRTKTQQELIDIIRFEIRGIPLPEGFAVSDETALTELAKRHDLTHLVYDALTKNGFACSSSFSMQQYYAAIWRTEQMDHELKALAELFESEGIDFLPLKGAMMRPLYPEPWMRTSADIDVLVRPEDQQKARDLLIEKLRYSYDPNDDISHHISINAPKSGVHIELHFTLFSDIHIGKTIRDIVSNLWNDPAYSTLKDGWMHWYVMSDAMFYFYHLAHMAKHISQSGGCPVRSLIDLWILDGLPAGDKEGRKTLLKKGELETFGQQMSALAASWFDDVQDPDTVSDTLEQYVFSGKLYGDINRRTANSVEKSGTAGYILQRVFLPYETLKFAYPVLEKHKWLTPLCQIARWTKVFKKEHRNNLKNQAHALVRAEHEDINEAREISRILGIEHVLDA